MSGVGNEGPGRRTEYYRWWTAYVFAEEEGIPRHYGPQKIRPIGFYSGMELQNQETGCWIGNYFSFSFRN